MKKIDLPRRTFLRSAVAGASVIAAPHVSRAQAGKEFKCSVTNDRPNPYVEATFRMADLVAERTSGRVRIKVYAQSQLVGGDATREFPALNRGVFEFLTSSTINLAPHIKEMGLFSLPFLLGDSRGWDAVVASDARQDLEARLAARDAIALGWSENGFRQINNSKRDIRKPADLVGLKIRYAASPLYADIFNALGANPVQMSWADHITALSTGAVDGSENPFSSFIQSKLYLLNQHHLTVWNYSTDANIFMVKSDVWNAFTPADRDIIKATTEEQAKWATARKPQGPRLERRSFGLRSACQAGRVGSRTDTR